MSWLGQKKVAPSPHGEDASDEGGVAYGGLVLKAKSLPHLVQVQAESRGDSTFVQTWDEGIRDSISFHAFNKKVSQICHLLVTDYGVSVGTRCAILGHNSTLYLAVSFAIMRAGGVSVNLNWRSPAQNLAELAQKTECDFLFATEAFKDAAFTIKSSIKRLVVVSLLCLQPKPNTALHKMSIPCKLSDTAVIFFTSGSTSLPKAVPHTHASLMWLAESYYRAFPTPYETTNPDAGTLCFFPYFHVMGFSVNMIL